MLARQHEEWPARGLASLVCVQGKHNTGQCYVTEEAAADEAWPLYRKLYNLPWIKPPPLKLLPQYRKQLQAALDEPAPAQSAGTQHAAILSDALPAPEQQQQ